MSRARKRSPRGWARLHSETARGVLSLLVGIAAAFVVGLLLERSREGAFDATELMFVGVAAYLVVYVWLTLLAFSRTRWSQVETWALRRTRAHWVTRVLTASEPGPGVAVGVGILALLVAVFWLPSQQGQGTLTTGQQLLLTGVLVSSAWLTVAVTYAVAYLMQDIRSGNRSLDFPGGGRRTFVDYLYFSLAVNSTFGPTDVQVLTTPLRKLVAGHGVTAFVFNTVILGAVVSMLVALR